MYGGQVLFSLYSVNNVSASCIVIILRKVRYIYLLHWKDLTELQAEPVFTQQHFVIFPCHSSKSPYKY